jgi:Na+-transporting NADH:ubiquinone oxidoreductase subunit NqrA
MPDATIEKGLNIPFPGKLPIEKLALRNKSSTVKIDKEDFRSVNYRVSQEWDPTVQSAQSIADRANLLGTTFLDSSGKLNWIGLPLEFLPSPKHLASRRHSVERDSAPLKLAENL